MTNMTELIKQLGEPFRKEDEETVKMNFDGTIRPMTYLNIYKVLARWNAILMGHASFRFELLTAPKDAVIGNDLVVLARLTLSTQEASASYDMYGGVKIERASQNLYGPDDNKREHPIALAGEPVQLGFDFKTAAADAFKKTASMFGVGAYLYDKEYYRSPSSEPAKTSSNGHHPVAAQTVPTVPVAVPVANGASKKANALQLKAIRHQLDIKQFLGLEAFLKVAQKANLEDLTQDEAAKFIGELNNIKMPKV